MTAMALAWKRELASLTLIAGDGDFRDLIEFVSRDMDKAVFMFMYKQSCPSYLKEFTNNQDGIFFLDDIWEEISEPIA